MNIFKSQEILKLAVQIEKNGLNFYQGVSEQTKNLSVKDIFDFLIKEEIRHRDTFQKMLDEIGDYEPVESYPGEYALYLEALAGENIFTKDAASKKIVSQIKDDREAVTLGIGFEKDSVIFFSEMKNFIPSSEQAIVDKVIDEERQHFTKLTTLKAKL